MLLALCNKSAPQSSTSAMQQVRTIALSWMLLSVLVAPVLTDAVCAEPASKPLMDGVTCEGNRVHLKGGVYCVLDRRVEVREPASFQIRGAEIVAVKDEPLRLSHRKPAGFFVGTKLAGPRAGRINALGSFIESSLVVARMPGGSPLVKGRDYLVSAPHALLGIGPQTEFTPNDTVYASYRYRLQRIDSIGVDAPGTAHLYEGTPTVSAPLPPDLPADCVPVLNVYRPFGATRVLPEHLFPLRDKPEQAVTQTTPGRIPKVLQKLQAGEKVKIVCWGDSVTVGGDASRPANSYVEVFIRRLKARFPQATIEHENISIGGTRSVQWLGGMAGKPSKPGLNFQRVLDAKPDLVTVEFINDTSLRPNKWTSVYTTVLQHLEAVGAELILITPHFGHMRLMRSQDLRMRDKRPYVAFLRQFAADHNIALADASARWEHLWKEGIPYLTLLHNHYNHPDDRGHALFADELIKCFEPAHRAETSAAGTRRLNLVVVLSDQHSSDMLGCYGNRDISTPNLDRFAAQGVRFHHCISNSPVCTPYRGILMSGQHPLYCGAMQNDLRILPGGGKYLGEVLRDAGYRMGYFGKWHLYGGDRRRPVPPGPYRYGFDHEFLTNNCTLAFDAKRAYYWDADGQKRLYGDWEPYAQTRQAMHFVEQHAGKPFALFLSWHPPHNWGRAHAGYAAPEDCLALYDPAKIHLRPTVEDSPRIRQMYQGHMAMITSLDRAFGWLMKELEDKGLVDNTLVVFTADHGDLLMSYGWPNNKGRPEHGSCRVPLLIRHPGWLKPRVSDLLIGTLDLMPTMLGLLDLPVPDTCQGQNLAQAIRAGCDDAVDSVPLFYLPRNWRGVYTHRYTYSFATNPQPNGSGKKPLFTYNCLYDRRQDPWEMKNLFDSSAHQAVRDKLHKLTRSWMERFGDPGLAYDEVLRRVVREADWPAVAAPPAKRPRGWEGRLKGRPVDFLRTADGM